MRAPRKRPNLRNPIALALLTCLVLAAPRAASDVDVASQGPKAVSQYDVGADGSLSKKSPAAVSAGNHPRGIAVSPDVKSVYVVDQGSGNVSQYDVGSGGSLSAKSPAKVPAGINPSAIAVSPA